MWTGYKGALKTTKATMTRTPVKKHLSRYVIAAMLVDGKQKITH